MWLASSCGVWAACVCRYIVCDGAGVGAVEGFGRWANGSPESGWTDWAVRLAELGFGKVPRFPAELGFGKVVPLGVHSARWGRVRVKAGQ